MIITNNNTGSRTTGRGRIIIRAIVITNNY